jgi:hypothetical protein
VLLVLIEPRTSPGMATLHRLQLCRSRKYSLPPPGWPAPTPPPPPGYGGYAPGGVPMRLKHSPGKGLGIGLCGIAALLLSYFACRLVPRDRVGRFVTGTLTSRAGGGSTSSTGRARAHRGC